MCFGYYNHQLKNAKRAVKQGQKAMGLAEKIARLPMIQLACMSLFA